MQLNKIISVVSIMFLFPDASSERWQNISLRIVAVAGAIAFCALLANVYVTRRANQAKKAESQQKDLLIAQANESAGKANERAEKLESDNLKLRGQVATLETQAADASKGVARLQKDAADAKAAQQRVEIDLSKATGEVAILQKETAEARQRQAEAERSLLELQERVKPRHLTAEQREKFVSILKQFPKVPVAVYCADSEACSFAKQLISALKAAGWNDMQGGDGNNLYAFSPPIIGVVVFRRERDPIPASYMALHDALIAAGIEHRFVYNETIPAGLIEVRIGGKP